ncbi:MAG TPA: ABC transporter substrate-binding protein [Burkholderiales bacterium]|nr:ABC transporter substrate-binding protein [Burkholderiales bacterium]
MVLTLGAGALFAPALVRAQPPKMYRIGYLANNPDPRASSYSFRAFVDALRESGWIEGKNLEIRIRSSGGRDEQFSLLAPELVRENVDVILTTGAASTRAAKAATESIPIVFGSTANPVELGLVASLSRPGGNVTGVGLMVIELTPKRLQLLREMIPRVSRIARLYSASNKTMQPSVMREPDAAARRMGVTLHHIAVAGPDDIESAFGRAARERVEAVIVEADAVFIVNRERVSALGLKHRLPLMCPDGRYAEAGALISYGENFTELYRRAGFLVDKILRGSKPAELPVELPTVFELMVNMKTASALGLSVPDSILLQANRIIK